MKSYLLEYKIKPGNFDKVSELIQKLIEHIQTEEDTLLYSPFHYKLEPNKFIHVISFENEAAEAKHMNSETVKKFMGELELICISQPNLIEVEYISQE